MTGAVVGELRLAVRRLRRSPGFTAAAVLTLALGIGANSALFSLADAALLRPLPYPTTDRLMMLWETQPAAGKPRERASAANFIDWRRQTSAFDEMAAWDDWGMAFTGAGEPEELSAVRVSPNLFSRLGVAPALGRAFLPEEETSGRDRVVVLSHDFWAGRFGGDPEVIGRTLTLDGQPHEIVGVMPEGFRFPDEASVALWNPLAFDASELATRAERRFQVIGRLAPGVTPADAQSQLELVAARLAEAHPETNAGWSAVVVRARKRWATLAHASRRTRATVPRRRVSAGRPPAATASAAGTTTADLPAFVSGCASASRAATSSSCDCASAGVTPRARRPMT